MQFGSKSKLIIPIVFAILIGIISRLIPHLPNFTPIAAMAIFAGVMFSRKSLAILLIFATLFVSDLLINNLMYSQYFDGFAWFSRGVIWIYAAYFCMIFLAPFLIKKIKALPILVSSLLGSSLFFILSNLGSFIVNYELYSRDLAGLAACYTAAIPFFGNTLIADLFFVGVLFGTYAFLEKKQLSPLRVRK